LPSAPRWLLFLSLRTAGSANIATLMCSNHSDVVESWIVAGLLWTYILGLAVRAYYH
jgi:hypothetical protein